MRRRSALANLSYYTKTRDSTNAYTIGGRKPYASHAVRTPALTNTSSPTLCARSLVCPTGNTDWDHPSR